jgi:hypothetical protein
METIGWDPNSFGYHGDDGNVFESSGKGKLFISLCDMSLI